MWKYLSGVEPPPKKSKNNYEEHRKPRSFREIWRENRAWLQYDEKEAAMYCTNCKNTSKQNEFVKSCRSFRLESVKIHESSEVHKHACEIVSNRETKVGDRPAEKALQQLNADIFEKLLLLFRNAHALAKHDRPYSDFAWLCQLDKRKGLNVGETYLNDKNCKIFIHAIALHERQKIKQEIENSPFVSILCDGSTDSSITDNEIIYLRYARHGTAIVKFLGCMSVEKADAKGVLSAMKSACQMNDLDWTDTVSKMVAMGSDGASVMLGVKHGVAALLKEANPSVVPVHCLGHRLELAYKDCLKKSTIGQKINSVLLMGLYYFYHNSPLNRSNLKNSSKVLGIKPKMPTRVGGTRWIGHILLALTNFFHSYQAIVQHLDQLVGSSGAMTTAKSKAKCFLKLMKNDSNMVFCAFLHDVLSALHVMSKIFQRENGTLADIHQALSNVRNILRQYHKRDGSLLTKMKSGECDYKPKQECLDSFDVSKRKFLQTLHEALDSRFSDADNGLVKATQIVDFKCWPDSSEKSEVEEFGDEHVKYISDHYKFLLLSSKVDVASVPTEWALLKMDVYSSFPDLCVTWPKLNKKYGDQYGNILSVIDLVLTMPSSSTECERGFSLMKKLKTDIRNKLSEESLSDNMVVQLESSPIESFDPTPAIHIWNNKLAIRKRKPNYNDDLKRKHEFLVHHPKLVDLVEESVTVDVIEDDDFQPMDDWTDDSDCDESEEAVNMEIEKELEFEYN